MTVTEAIRERRSIRRYKANMEVTDEQLKALLEAAMMAPSASNGRPWEFVVVRSRDVLKEIMKVHVYAQMLESASLAIFVCGLPDASPSSKDYFPQDCAAATMNILLQAAELGLGTCWCGVYPKQDRVEGLKAVIGVDSIPLSLIAVGVPDEAPKAKGFYDPSRVKYL